MHFRKRIYAHTSIPRARPARDVARLALSTVSHSFRYPRRMDDKVPPQRSHLWPFEQHSTQHTYAAKAPHSAIRPRLVGQKAECAPRLTPKCGVAVTGGWNWRGQHQCSRLGLWGCVLLLAAFGVKRARGLTRPSTAGSGLDCLRGPSNRCIASVVPIDCRPITEDLRYRSGLNPCRHPV